MISAADGCNCDIVLSLRHTVIILLYKLFIYPHCLLNKSLIQLYDVLYVMKAPQLSNTF